MPIASKDGKLVVNQSGTGLRENCPASCVAKLTQYVYYPCDVDVGGAHNYHRSVKLNPSASALDLAQSTPSFSWSHIYGQIGTSWNYTEDSNVIAKIRQLARNAVSAGCVTAELGGSLAEAGTFGGSGAVWFDNAPSGSMTTCVQVHKAAGRFYYNVSVSGSCGKAYCTWWYEDTFGAPVAFNKSTGAIQGSNGSWWQPNYVLSAGSHDIDTRWSASDGNLPESWGLVVVFLA